MAQHATEWIGNAGSSNSPLTLSRENDRIGSPNQGSGCPWELRSILDFEACVSHAQHVCPTPHRDLEPHTQN